MSGRALSAKKSQWTFIDFTWKKGKRAYKSTSELPSTLLMNNVSGSRISLDWLEPHKAEHSLGLRIAPDGNYAAELQFHKEQTLLWASQLIHSKIPQHITWLNFKTVLLKKVEYPLMVTTFSCNECDDIFCPAINAVLPALGINHHFPQDMIHGHADHFRLAIPNLYNSQGFLHLSALLKFGSMPCTTGQLLQHTYETLQLEVGLPGEILMQPFVNWALLCTKSWLTHTWQYASENDWEIVTGLPSLLPKCEHDWFLVELFWLKGYHAKQLAELNHCQLCLQVTMLADMVDGCGSHVLPSILSGKRAIYLLPCTGGLSKHYQLNHSGHYGKSSL